MVYSKKVMDAFRDPHNYGKMKDADGIGKVGNAMCGDLMWLYIKVEEDKIKEISFETFGCVAAIASSEIITEIAKGKTVKEALALDKEEILEELDNLPPIKIHCSILAVDALHEAIHDYLQKNKKEIPNKLEEKHKLLAKQRELVEERYKDWVQKEEEIHDQE